MRINTIQLFSNGVQKLDLTLNRANRTNQYIVQTMSGLDTDDIGMLVTGAHTQTGANFYTPKLRPRTISLKIRLNPSYGVGSPSSGSLRDDIYRLIGGSPDGMVQLRFLDGSTNVANISGYITKLENDLFSKEQEVQLTIRCEQPLFRSLTTVNPAISSFNPLSVTDSLSTAPHGFQMRINLSGSLSSIRITDTNDGLHSWFFEVTYNFVSSDTFQFSSMEDDRYVRTLRAGIMTQLGDRVTPGSQWPLIRPGINNFYVNANGVVNSFSYYNTYWGI